MPREASVDNNERNARSDRRAGEVVVIQDIHANHGAVDDRGLQRPNGHLRWFDPEDTSERQPTVPIVADIPLLGILLQVRPRSRRSHASCW